MNPDKKPGLKVLLSLYLKEKYPNWIKGTLERRMNGKSVEYRYKQKEEVRQATHYRCTSCSKDAAKFDMGKPVCLDHKPFEQSLF